MWIIVFAVFVGFVIKEVADKMKKNIEDRNWYNEEVRRFQRGWSEGDPLHYD